MKRLITFLVLSYFLSWFVWMPLCFKAWGYQNVSIMPFQFGLGYFGPLVAALVTNTLHKDNRQTVKLIKSIYKPKAPLFWIVAFIAPFVIYLGATAINHYINHTPISLTNIGRSRESVEYTFLKLLAHNLLFLGLAGESGWRGFALPTLQKHMNALLATIVLTIFWAGWHLPMFIFRESYKMLDTAGIIQWLYGLLAAGVILTWLFNSSRGSILACAIFYAVYDMVIISNPSDPNIISYAILLVAAWALLTIIIFKPSMLSVKVKVTGVRRKKR